jgi:hypothetical protein
VAETPTNTPVEAQAGDRIVVEVGCRASGDNVAYTAKVWYGGTDATDLSNGADERVYTGWIDFTLEAGGTNYPQAVAGILTATGTLSRNTGKSLAGILIFSGIIQKAISVTISGILTFKGILWKTGWNRILKAILSWSAITKAVTNWTSGTKPSTEWTETTKPETEWTED